MDKEVHAPVEDSAEAKREHMLLRMPKETKLRSATKVILYRIAGSTATAALVDVLVNVHAHSNHTSISLLQDSKYGIAAFLGDAGLKLGMQFMSERIWAHVSWGYTHNNGDEPAMISKLRKGYANVKDFLRKYPGDERRDPPIIF
ncbi:MAG: hypothetical protein ABSA33_00545 [Candidatus Micrarchaeaceae archaeon]